MKDRHLISVDELRAAGALDVPPAWRKSLHVERDLFSDLFDDDEPAASEPGPGEPESAPSEPHGAGPERDGEPPDPPEAPA